MHTYHPIDLQNWERREIYEHFSRLRTLHYAVAANIEVTRLLEYKRQHRLSFYLSLIYLATQAQNGRWLLNVSVTVNHRFVDGYHIGLFFQRLQALLDSLPL